MSAGPIRRRLADGREILYFDDATERPHDAVDRRPLDPTVVTSTVRGDPFTREWTTVASHRQARTFLPPAENCPLCPSRDGRLTEIPESRFDVAVFENRFPAFAGDGSDPHGPPDPSAQGWDVHAGSGRCEVVVPTDDHDATIAVLPISRVRTMIDAWAQRSAELSQRPDVAAVAVFENRGELVGVTLDHTHQQVYAFPFLPPVTALLLQQQDEYRARLGGCLVCDRLTAERSEGSRVVLSMPHWTVFVPFAAKWPFEVNVVPHRHLRGLPDLDDTERDELATLWRDLFRRYDALFDVPRLPTIGAWHQTPAAGLDGHLFGQVFSLQRDEHKLKYLAGSESAFGAWILDVVPERAAEMLRAVGG